MLTLCSQSYPVWPGLPWVAAMRGQAYPVKWQRVASLTCAAAMRGHTYPVQLQHGQVYPVQLQCGQAYPVQLQCGAMVTV